MRKQILLLNIVLLSVMGVKGQEKHKMPDMPVLAVKTNALYWATATPNLGVEFALSKKFTMDISGNYNPWKWSDNKKLKHWLVQPELRYWLCDRFNGHFFGVHAFYVQFNMCGIEMFGWKHERYQGDLYGGGIVYGYHWILNKRWSLEGTIGVGYAHIEYDKYRCETCGPKLKEDRRNYVGPTKVGINLIYIMK